MGRATSLLTPFEIAQLRGKYALRSQVTILGEPEPAVNGTHLCKIDSYLLPEVGAERVMLSIHGRDVRFRADVGT